MSAENTLVGAALNEQVRHELNRGNRPGAETVRNLLRQFHALAQSDLITPLSLSATVYPPEREVYLDTDLDMRGLPPRLHNLFRLLEQPGVHSKNEIMAAITCERTGKPIKPTTVRTLVKLGRDWLDSTRAPLQIITVHKKGYQFKRKPEPASD